MFAEEVSSRHIWTPVGRTEAHRLANVEEGGVEDVALPGSSWEGVALGLPSVTVKYLPDQRQGIAPS